MTNPGGKGRNRGGGGGGPKQPKQPTGAPRTAPENLNPAETEQEKNDRIQREGMEALIRGLRERQGIRVGTPPAAPAAPPAPEPPRPAPPAPEAPTNLAAQAYQAGGAPGLHTPDSRREPPAPDPRAAVVERLNRNAAAATPTEPASFLEPGLIDSKLPESEREVLRLALRTRGKEAMLATQEALRGYNSPNYVDSKGNQGTYRSPYKRNEKFMSSKTQDEQHKAALVFAEGMYSAEKEYFDAYKQQEKTRGFGSIVGDKFFKAEYQTPEVRALKEKWIKARAGYGEHMLGSAAERHDRRQAGHETHKYRNDREKVLARYQRRFVTKEILLGAEEAQQRARMEGLASRDKKGLEKLFDKWGGMPKAVRVLVSSAIVGTMGIATAALFGSGLGLIASVMAVPAAGFALASMLNKDPDKKAKYADMAGVSALLTPTGLFRMAGGAVAGFGHWLTGTKRNADKKLKQNEGLGDLSNEANLRKVSGQRHKALRADENIDIDKRRFGMAASFAGGAAIGGVLNHEMANIGSMHINAPHFGGGPDQGGLDQGNGIDHITIGDHDGGVNINDADKALGHFAQHLRHDTYANGGEPPVVQRFFDLLKSKGDGSFLSGEDHASIQLGLEGPDGSTVMQPGDTISLHDTPFGGHEIVLDRPGYPDMHHVLMDDNGIHPVDSNVWEQAPVVHHAPAPVEHASQTSAPAAPTAPEAVHSAPTVTEVTPPVDTRALYQSLQAEQVRAAAAYNAGLQTPDQLATYNHYMTNLDSYNKIMAAPTHGLPHPENNPVAPHQDGPAPREVIAPAPNPNPPVHVEAPTPPTVEHLPESVRAIENSPAWNYGRLNFSIDVLNNPPPATDTAEIAFREQFLRVVHESGLQPVDHQRVDAYIQLATKAIEAKATVPADLQGLI